jgi:hypothetical protein
VELRQYTLRAGQRDVLVELFEREFIESQEALGMALLGQFRDIDRPDRFVWLRGYAEPQSRAAALQSFYTGPVWRAHRDAANATMLDVDDVHLLRPSRPVGGLPTLPRDHGEATSAQVEIHVLQLAEDAEAAFCAHFERHWLPLLWNANVPVLATYVCDPRPNEFPALPAHPAQALFVWISRFADARAAAQAQARVDQALEWMPTIAEEYAALVRHARRLRLAPTPRSRLGA